MSHDLLTTDRQGKEKREMGRIQVIAIHVEGDDAVIDQALKICAEAIAGLNGNEPRLAPASPASPIQGTLPNSNGKKHECHICFKICGSPQGLGKHVSSMHGPASRSATDKKQYFCPVKNCARGFKTSGRRDLHLLKDHGLDAPVHAA